MAKKEDELFKEWVDEVSSGLDSEEEKAAFQSFLKTKAARETLRGVTHRRELDRRMNEVHEVRRQLEQAEAVLKSKDQELRNWYEKESPKNAQLVAELEETKQKLRELAGEDDPPPSAGTVSQLPFSKEELEALKQKAAKIDMFDQNLPRLLGDLAAITKRSLQEGFDVDPRDVIAYATKNHVDPFRAYEDMTLEARQKKFDEERAEEIKKAKEEGRREALSNLKSSPDHIRPNGPSVVDILQEGKPLPDKRERVNAAVRDFLEMGSPS